jgi:hypothetical protein
MFGGVAMVLLVLHSCTVRSMWWPPSFPANLLPGAPPSSTLGEFYGVARSMVSAANPAMREAQRFAQDMVRGEAAPAVRRERARNMLRVGLGLISHAARAGLLVAKISDALRSPLAATSAQRAELVVDTLVTSIPMLQLVVLLHPPARDSFTDLVRERLDAYGLFMSDKLAASRLLALFSRPTATCPRQPSPFTCPAA